MMGIENGIKILPYGLIIAAILLYWNEQRIWERLVKKGKKHGTYIHPLY